MRIPEPFSVENEAGMYRLEVQRSQGEVVCTVTTRVDAEEIPAAAWPALRALLLAERDTARRTVLLRP